MLVSEDFTLVVALVERDVGFCFFFGRYSGFFLLGFWSDSVHALFLEFLHEDLDHTQPANGKAVGDHPPKHFKQVRLNVLLVLTQNPKENQRNHKHHLCLPKVDINPGFLIRLQNNQQNVVDTESDADAHNLEVRISCLIHQAHSQEQFSQADEGFKCGG